MTATPLLWTPPDITKDKPGKLELVCRKCTREGIWYAKWMPIAVKMALLEGWTTSANNSFVCPSSPK